MVVCNMENFVIPKPPAPPIGLLHKEFPLMIKTKKTSVSSGFRLVENQQEETGSVYSVYKQKIDAMFESDSSTQTKNSVQARIEKMFTEVAIDSGIPLNDIGRHTFSVDYLGSVPLQEKVTSLAGLQMPLKELYFAYKRTTRPKQPLTGRLEISANGLKVQYQGDKGDLEQLNSFPTIAVWSAVKFILQDDNKTSYAFLPLITDPDNIEKQQLFKTLDSSEKKYIGIEHHSPLFAVVMRKIGVHKQLECHGFVCQTSEDAIVIAATLYKSLMAHMKAKEKRPKNKNGVTCMSMASSACNDSNTNVPVRPPRKKRSSTSSVSDKDMVEVSETKPLLSDGRLPKKSTKTKRAPKVPEQKVDLDAIVPYEEPVQPKVEEPDEIKPKPINDTWNTYMSNQQKQIADEIKQVINEGANMGLKRAKSVRKRTEEGIINANENSGDILTKVTIPRSGSFLNTGGLTRYKSKVHRSNGQASGGSPLGFNELFNEFRLQEGLNSMDEILGVIIDSEGMSFNDLKPIYKEFLLKLAVTLTKDELYQRSKSIMRRQKKKLLRRTSTVKTRKSHVIVCSKFKSLKHVFQKIKLGKKHLLKQKSRAASSQAHGKLPESSISTSSYDTRQFRPKEQQITRKQSYRKRANEKIIRRERTSTSEESDFFSLRRAKAKAQNFDSKTQNRNSSSGYVSYSECSYDSDTCTCTSADKCYCSLGQKHQRSQCRASSRNCKLGDKCYCSRPRPEESLTWCGCDTDSCTDSNKCYCQTFTRSTIFEQLKQRGFVPSSDSLVSPSNTKKLCKKNSNTKSTRSLEYMHNPSEQYYEKLVVKNKMSTNSKRRSYSTENLALDYDLFTIDDKGHHVANRASYGRSFSESGNVPFNMLKQASVRSHASSARCTQKGKMLQSSSIPAEECTEALSVKKSAEIAALFADVKLSQTTDITHLIPRNHPVATVSSKSNYSQILPSQGYPNQNRSSMIERSSRTGRESVRSSRDSMRSSRDSVRSRDSMRIEREFLRNERGSLRGDGNFLRNDFIMDERNFERDMARIERDLMRNERNSSRNSLRSDKKFSVPCSNRMVLNSLYATKNLPKNHMYSAKNGLYTIQSQSDDSRRSSVSGGRRRSVSGKGEYLNVEPMFGKYKNAGQNLETSLGYLP